MTVNGQWPRHDRSSAVRQRAVSSRIATLQRRGRRKWLQWTATANVSRGLIYAVARDVTARKHTEETVFAAMRDGIVIMDADGSIRTCNRSAERILGLSSEQIMGRTALDPRWRAIHEDGSPFPAETFPVTVTLRARRPCSGIVMGVYKPDGALTWISINSQPLLDADGVTPGGVVASFEDITERKRTDAALREASAELLRVSAGRSRVEVRGGLGVGSGSWEFRTASSSCVRLCP